MQDIRKILWWLFAVTSLLHTAVFLRCILHGVRYHYPPPLFRSLFVTALFSFVLAILAGVAWWTIWKDRQSARGWAIAASVMTILIFVRQFIFPPQPPWYSHLGALYIGIVGVVAFSWHDDGRTSETTVD